MTDGFTRTLTPAWIVYVDGRRLDPEHEGLLKAILTKSAHAPCLFQMISVQKESLHF